MAAAYSIPDVLRRIRTEDASLHAFLHVTDDPGEPFAGSSERLLGGLPVAVKDIMDTADMPTSYGSLIYEGHRPNTDAAIVSALKKAGAFIVGKTTTTEFATAVPTRTLNPRNNGHTPGGSSAGSAAAVAAGLVPVALGTQTLGSVIRPASYCGVVGFKPTYGWFPTSGMKNLSTSLDTIGFLTSTVTNAEQVYRALAPGDVEPSPGSPRLAFSRRPNWDLADPDARAAIESCVEGLRSAGFAIDDLEMSPGFEDITRVGNVIHDYEMYRALGPEFATARDRMNPALAARIEQAARWTVADYRAALKAAERERIAFGKLMESYDAVLCLAASGEAPAGLTNTGSPMMSSAWTTLHAPCLTLPLMKGATGLPIGLQLVADRYQDLKLLSIATAIESASAA